MSDLLLIAFLTLSVVTVYRIGKANGRRKGLTIGFETYRKVGKLMFDKFENEARTQRRGK